MQQAQNKNTFLSSSANSLCARLEPQETILSLRNVSTRMLTPINIKYITLNRTFSCNKATQELGYKPIVSLQVVTLTRFARFDFLSWYLVII